MLHPFCASASWSCTAGVMLRKNKICLFLAPNLSLTTTMMHFALAAAVSRATYKEACVHINRHTFFAYPICSATPSLKSFPATKTSSLNCRPAAQPWPPWPHIIRMSHRACGLTGPCTARADMMNIPTGRHCLIELPQPAPVSLALYHTSRMSLQRLGFASRSTRPAQGLLHCDSVCFSNKHRSVSAQCSLSTRCITCGSPAACRMLVLRSDPADPGECHRRWHQKSTAEIHCMNGSIGTTKITIA